jgi:hypothetical protein
MIIDGIEYVKKEPKDNRFNYIITDEANVLGIIPLFKSSEDITDDVLNICSEESPEKSFYGSYKQVENKDIHFQNIGLDIGDVIILSKTRFSREMIDKSKKTAKHFFFSEQKPLFYIKWDKEKNEFIEDYPCLIVYSKLVFILAPRIRDEE